MSFDLGFIEFRDEWLQDLLWNKLDPKDFYQSDRYTKIDLMKHLEQMNSQGLCYFWGSKSLGFVVRANLPNRFVLEPHVVGDVSHWKTIQPILFDFAFNHMGILKTNVYTPYRSIKGILVRSGFTLEGTLKDSYIDKQGYLKPYYILGLTKDEFLKLSTTPTSRLYRPIHVDG